MTESTLKPCPFCEENAEIRSKYATLLEFVKMLADAITHYRHDLYPKKVRLWSQKKLKEIGEIE